MGLSPAAATMVGLSRSAGNTAVVGLASGSAPPPPNLASLGALARATRFGTLPMGGPVRGPQVDDDDAEADTEDDGDAGSDDGTADRRPDGLAGGFAQALQRRSLARREDSDGDRDADEIDGEVPSALRGPDGDGTRQQGGRGEAVADRRTTRRRCRARRLADRPARHAATADTSRCSPASGRRSGSAATRRRAVPRGSLPACRCPTASAPAPERTPTPRGSRRWSGRPRRRARCGPPASRRPAAGPGARRRARGAAGTLAWR